MASGRVFNHAITNPPITVASYLSPRISPPSDTHHAPTSENYKKIVDCMLELGSITLHTYINLLKLLTY